jgi:hypothetical protein
LRTTDLVSIGGRKRFDSLDFLDRARTDMTKFHPASLGIATNIDHNSWFDK